MRPVVAPAEAETRLKAVFGEAFDTTLSNRLAAYAVVALLYIDAVADGDPEVWARPSTVYWLTPDVLEHRTSDEERAAWRAAAAANSKKVVSLLAEWGLAGERIYADTTRETLRDETWRKMHELGAMRRRPGVPTASPKPTWALEPHFADLFDPTLEGDDLRKAILKWVDTHLPVGARLKVQVARRNANQGVATQVTLPDGTVRYLEAGGSSLILKGVIEQWAPAKLGTPHVLAISEPGDKIYVGDSQLLGTLGVKIDVGKLLPDALLADLDGDVSFWVVEAVASDGPVTEARKAELIKWAESQMIAPERLHFLTAFLSRNAGPARRRLKDLAEGTAAWFLDEPEMELLWVPIGSNAGREETGPC